MNQTATPPPPPPGAPHGSDTGPDADRLRSVTSTRRATDGRLVAGVASGIGRQLGIDPIIVRIVLVALCFAGLSGLILYAAAWFVLPSDDGRRSVMADWFRLGSNEPQLRVAALVVAAALALVAIVGDSGWYWGGPSLGLLWIIVPALFLYWVFAVLPRQRGGGRASSVPGPAGPSPTPPAAESAASPAGESPTAVLDDPDSNPAPSGDDGVPPPPAPQAAPGGPPPRPHVPRTPPTLFLATTSVMLIALGSLATVHAAAGLDLAPETYPAVALGIVGAGLLVGARWGRSIALVPVGVVLALVLGAIGVVPDGPVGDLRPTPTTAAAVDAEYRLGAGSLRLDLSEVSDPEDLLGRTIVIDGGLGQVRIILPRDLAVTVEATISGGEIRVLGEQTSGQGASLDVVSDERPALTLEIEHTFGQIDVERA
ncbi:PspC domain-containing protein [Aeromicrobium sp. Sec7.5]|uniref:PspC domain-containing protein n=1 Tax=Aeromicrobium sp. Sec7.5 TaxID=3121276 RepID=UPI002FE4522D